ncbi:MAG: hypothetical protein NDJ92_09480 [Thermoanaerobaculia bacterium]|nr:hypothetical protein [Thermoanaerobaculia bacterium]
MPVSLTKSRAALALIAITVTTAMTSEAATVRRLELDEIRAKAESVFVGEVVGVSARLGSDGRMVWTDYEIEIGETLAGRDAGPRTTLSFAGGTVPELSIGIPGVPELYEGNHYVFFIEPKPDSPTALIPMPTVGWGQGLYKIARIDKDDGSSSTALVSVDGEPLELSADGLLARGAHVRITGGRIVEAESAIRDAAPTRMRPSRFESPDGTVRVIAPTPAPVDVAVRTARTFATLDDLRLFVQGRLAAVNVRNR